jgi:hypothetical protein
MIVIDNADAIRGDASVASKVDFTVNGIVGTTPTQLADGQLADSEGNLYASGADATVVLSITLVNTHTSAVTVNLYLKPSAGTSRRIIPKTTSLAAGYSLHTDGVKVSIINPTGGLVTQYGAHATNHQDAGSDEISLTGLSGDPADTVNKSLIDAKGDLIVGSADNTVVRLAVGTNAKILSADSGETSGLKWIAPPSAADFQRFTSSGTWTKPSGVTHVIVECIGGGGGGGGGAGAAVSSFRGGGGGGGGGANITRVVPAASCGATETVTVGAAGTAGPGGNGGVGTDGGAGGDSSFGSLVKAYGGGGGYEGRDAGAAAGGGGGGGSASAGGTGTSSAGIPGNPHWGTAATTGDSLAGGGALGSGRCAEYGGAGGGTGGYSSVGTDGGSSMFGGGAGAGGGGINNSNPGTERAGGTGGAGNSYTAAGGGTAGAAGGTAGGAGVAGTYEYCGAGGGGGGSKNSGTGGAGGAGGAPGGAGGGGGGGTSIGGAGGLGAKGEVRVWSW